MVENRSNITPYPDINDLLNKLKTDVKAILGKQFVGMYIHGSLVVGDFNIKTSDIDFLIITKDALKADVISQLKVIHKLIINSHLKWGKKLEGSYIPINILKEYNPPKTPRPYINEGEFHLARSGWEWVLEKYVLLQHGIIIEGPSLKSLINPISPDNLKQATRNILVKWWQPMLQDTTRLKCDGYRAYAVLTMCRALYTLRYGTIVSKPEAATWAKKELNSQWKTIIDLALRDIIDVEMLDEVLNFIKFTLNYSSNKM